MSNSSDIRSRLVRAVELDLVGSSDDNGALDEVLPQNPSQWYLTGFLVPVEAD